MRLPGRWLNSLVYILGQHAVALHLRFLKISHSHISAGDLGCLVDVIKSQRRPDIHSLDGKHCTLLVKVMLGPEPMEFDNKELSERWSALLAGGLIVTHTEE